MRINRATFFRMQANESGPTIEVFDCDLNKDRRVVSDNNFPITSSLLLSNGLLLIGTANGNIKLINLDENKEVYFFNGHTQSVSALVEIGNNCFASASFDGTIVVWSLEQKVKNVVIKAHELPISSLLYHNDQLISAGYDGKIKSWDLTGALLFVLSDHKDYVFSLALLSNNILASLGGNSDHCIKYWDLNEKTLLKSQPISNCYHSNKLIFLNNNTLLSVGSNTVNVWDASRLELLITHHNFIESIVSAAPLTEEVMAISSGGSVVLMNVKTGVILNSLFLHHDAVTDVLVSSRNKLVTTGLDGVVNQTDFRLKSVSVELLSEIFSNEQIASVELGSNVNLASRPSLTIS